MYRYVFSGIYHEVAGNSSGLEIITTRLIITQQSAVCRYIVKLPEIFMWGIYNCIPETNHVSRVSRVSSYSVFTICATCNVISPMKYVLYFYIRTFCSLCALPNMAVFCISLILCFPSMLLRYCLSAFEILVLLLPPSSLSSL